MLSALPLLRMISVVRIGLMGHPLHHIVWRQAQIGLRILPEQSVHLLQGQFAGNILQFAGLRGNMKFLVGTLHPLFLILDVGHVLGCAALHGLLELCAMDVIELPLLQARKQLLHLVNAGTLCAG